MSTKKEIVKKNNVSVAVVNSSQVLIKNVPSALDFVMNIKYETGCTNIVVNKEAVTEETA